MCAYHWTCIRRVTTCNCILEHSFISEWLTWVISSHNFPVLFQLYYKNNPFMGKNYPNKYPLSKEKQNALSVLMFIGIRMKGEGLYLSLIGTNTFSLHRHRNIPVVATVAP